MSCRRICRELLWLARFGEFGPSSAPHLDHLAQCGHCRDEVGFDRILVQQLRRALAERVEQSDPSPGAWGAILERAQAQERGIGAFLQGQAATLAARLRTATAITAVALAGIIASSTHVAITHPEAGSAETEVITSAAGEHFERQPLVLRPREAAARVPVTYVVSVEPSDPEAAFIISASLPAAVPVDDTGSISPPTDPAGTAEETSGIESSVSIGRLSRATPVDPATADQLPAAEPEPTSADAGVAEPF